MLVNYRNQFKTQHHFFLCILASNLGWKWLSRRVVQWLRGLVERLGGARPV